MSTQTSPLTGKQVHYDNIKHFPTKDAANTEIAARKETLRMHPQYVGADNAWIIEGHYNSAPYGNPYVLRTDNMLRQVHTDKPATR